MEKKETPKIVLPKPKTPKPKSIGTKMKESGVIEKRPDTTYTNSRKNKTVKF